METAQATTPAEETPATQDLERPAGEPAAYQDPAADQDAGPAFDDSPPETATAPVVQLDSRRTRQVVTGILKALDRALSFLLRVPMSTAEELSEFAEVIAPAAEQHGEKIGPRFWTLAAGVGFAGFLLGKLAQAAVARKRPEAAPDQDPDQDQELAPRGNGATRTGPRKLGGNPIYPGERR